MAPRLLLNTLEVSDGPADVVPILLVGLEMIRWPKNWNGCATPATLYSRSAT
jgi:hypothetical protein